MNGNPENSTEIRLPNPRQYLGIFFLSAATLTYEVTLSRIFSVAQFYHFAFMIVSIALLGFGASGTILAIFPQLRRRDVWGDIRWLALATGVSILGSYLLTNWVPFDSFSIAWDRRQLFILILHYLALATPFFFGGMAVSLLLSAYSHISGKVYAINLFGSAFGCLISLVFPYWLGGEGIVVLSGGLAVVAAYACREDYGQHNSKRSEHLWLHKATQVFQLILLILITAYLGARIINLPPSWFLGLRLSPYKSLSYALQQPSSKVTYQRWNSFSRVDVVRSSGIHSLVGLSYRYLAPPPAEDGLFVDGDDLSPIIRAGSDMGFARYQGSAIAYMLRPEAESLILEPRGGVDILSALELGAGDIVAVESNPLIIESAGAIYRQPGVTVIQESERSYLHRSKRSYDIILFPLSTSYHPVRSGAYSLAEDYRHTVESFQDALARLNPRGLIVITRWLQMPPSECLRTFALAVTAVEQSGGAPDAQIVAFRSYNTLTILIKKTAFEPKELEEIRVFTSERAFDMVYAIDIRAEETNRYNILPQSVYYETFTGLIEAEDRQIYYENYPYNIKPPTDDKPFYGHYFKWSQARQIMDEFGKIWQPFGGAGYFVIAGLLVLTLILSITLIIFPVIIARVRLAKTKSWGYTQSRGYAPPSFSVLIYFCLIGLAYLLVEIPLIQRFILYLDHPAYAMTAVLSSLLLFSGIGSQMSQRIPLRYALLTLVILLICMPVAFQFFITSTLGLPLIIRIALAVLVLSPIGFLMGVPFPGGIMSLLEGEGRGGQVPWIWAANGSASVVAAVLAALLALSFGFKLVLIVGAVCYACALLITGISWIQGREHRASTPPEKRKNTVSQSSDFGGYAGRVRRAKKVAIADQIHLRVLRN